VKSNENMRRTITFLSWCISPEQADIGMKGLVPLSKVDRSTESRSLPGQSIQQRCSKLKAVVLIGRLRSFILLRRNGRVLALCPSPQRHVRSASGTTQEGVDGAGGREKVTEGAERGSREGEGARGIKWSNRREINRAALWDLCCQPGPKICAALGSALVCCRTILILWNTVRIQGDFEISTQRLKKNAFRILLPSARHVVRLLSFNSDQST
jgi:hypothetical protein